MFNQKKLAVYLELITKKEIFTDDVDPSLAEIEEVLFNLDFFEVPLSNNPIDLGISFIQNIKMVLKRISNKRS